MPTYRCPMNCTKEWKKLPINERADSNLNTIICCVMRLRSSLSNQIGKIHGKEILEVGWLLVMRQPGCPDGKVSVKQDLLYSLNGFFHCSIELVGNLFLLWYSKQADYSGEEVHVISKCIIQSSCLRDKWTVINNHYGSAADTNYQNEKYLRNF